MGRGRFDPLRPACHRTRHLHVSTSRTDDKHGHERASHAAYDTKHRVDPFVTCIRAPRWVRRCSIDIASVKTDTDAGIALRLRGNDPTTASQ
jgi:hypothetical protein